MIVWSVNGLNSFFGIAPHKALFPPSPVPVPAVAHVEGGLRMWDSALFRKIAKRTFFDGFPAVQRGHDVGFFIPHYNVLPPFPPNVLLAAIIPFSSAKAIFARSNVLVEGRPAAASHPSMNLLLCGDPVKVPTGAIVDSYLNTVIFSYARSDWLRGLANAAWDNARTRLIGKVAKATGGERLGKWLERKLGRYTWRLARLWLKTRFRLSLKGPISEELFEKLLHADSTLRAAERAFGEKAWTKLIDKIPMVGPEETAPAEPPGGKK